MEFLGIREAFGKAVYTLAELTCSVIMLPDAGGEAMIHHTPLREVTPENPTRRLILSLFLIRISH